MKKILPYILCVCGILHGSDVPNVRSLFDTRIKKSIQIHDAAGLKTALKLVRSLTEDDYTRYRVIAQQELYTIHRKRISYHPLCWGILSGISFITATVIANSDEIFPQRPHELSETEMVSMVGRRTYPDTISPQAETGFTPSSSPSLAQEEDDTSSDTSNDNASDETDIFHDALTELEPMAAPDIINTPKKSLLKNVKTLLRTVSSPVISAINPQRASIGATALCFSTWLWQWRAQHKSLALEKKAQECITILEGSRNPIPDHTQTVLPE